MGSSYGGYAALAGLAFTPDLYACGISLSGPSNLVTTLRNSWAASGLNATEYRLRVGDIKTPEGREALRSVSPYFYANQFEAPLLVGHGVHDARVEVCESKQMAAALYDAGKNIELLLADGEAHNFQDRGAKMAIYARIERFLSKHLGGRSQEKTTESIKRGLAALKVDLDTLKNSRCSR